MDLLRRFFSQPLRENMDDLHRSEMLRNQVYMIHAKREVLSPQRRRFLVLA
jgi:hypothetical protein